MRAWLVDTGPLVAYLDATEPDHAAVAARWDGFNGRLVTSSAVITETMHFVSATPTGPRALAELVAASAMEVYDLSAPPELGEAVALMERYADTPMDFADATLVLLAEAFRVNDVLTLDRRGFRTYRTRAGRALRLVLESWVRTRPPESVSPSPGSLPGGAPRRDRTSRPEPRRGDSRRGSGDPSVPGRRRHRARRRAPRGPRQAAVMARAR